VFNKNYIILHLIESYRHSQWLPSVTLRNCGTFYVPAFFYFPAHTVWHISIWKQLEVTRL